MSGPLRFSLRELLLLLLEQPVHIDQYEYCYILSESADPYATLTRAMQPAAK